MTWSYDADPASDRKDQVRWLVGDTDPLDELVQDEEIELALVMYPPATDKPAWLAAAHVADAITAQFARKSDRSVGPLSNSLKQQRDHYRELSADLRMLHATNGKTNASGFAGVTLAVPILGGGGKKYLGDD